MSFGITDPANSEMASNKASKDGSDIISPETWRSSLGAMGRADIGGLSASGGIRFHGQGGFASWSSILPADITFLNGSYTFTIRHKPADFAAQRTLLAGGGANEQGWQLQLDSATSLSFVVFNSEALEQYAVQFNLSQILEPNRFYTFTFSISWSDTNIEPVCALHVDTAPVSGTVTSPFTALVDKSSWINTLNLGYATDSASTLHGDTGSFAIFERILSTSDIAFLCRDRLAAIAQLGGYGPGQCLLAMPMDDGAGYRLHDLSPNRYDANLSATDFSHLLPADEGSIRVYNLNADGVTTHLLDSSRDWLPDRATISDVIVVSNTATSGSLTDAAFTVFRSDGTTDDSIEQAAQDINKKRLRIHGEPGAGLDNCDVFIHYRIL